MSGVDHDVGASKHYEMRAGYLQPRCYRIPVFANHATLLAGSGAVGGISQWVRTWRKGRGP